MTALLSIAVVALLADAIEAVSLPTWRGPESGRKIDAALFPDDFLTLADGPGYAYQPAISNGGMKTPLSGDEASKAPALTHKVATATAAHGVGSDAFANTERKNQSETPGCSEKVRRKGTFGDGTAREVVTAGETAQNECGPWQVDRASHTAAPIRALRLGTPRRTRQSSHKCKPRIATGADGNTFAKGDTESPVRGEPRAGRMAIAQGATKAPKTAATISAAARKADVQQPAMDEPERVIGLSSRSSARPAEQFDRRGSRYRDDRQRERFGRFPLAAPVLNFTPNQ